MATGKLLIDENSAGSGERFCVRLEATRQIRAAQGDDIPIVAITSLAMIVDRQRIQEAGCNVILISRLILCSSSKIFKYAFGMTG